MSRSVREYADDDRSMIALVFAPCTPEAGADRNWLMQTDEHIIYATLEELGRLFPAEVSPDARTAPPQPASSRLASLRKFSVVRVPRSVYAAVPGAGKFRPSQETPIDNFVLAGDWSTQKFLGSMEGAVLAGKLASEVVACKAAGVPTPNGGARVATDEPVPADAPEVPSAPGFVGNSPVAFGGGQTGGLVHP